MGWNVTCEFCGESEKQSHPACDCLQKRRDEILRKLIGASALELFLWNDNSGPSGLQFEVSKYKKDDDVFYVRRISHGGYDEYTFEYEYIKEIDETTYNKYQTEANNVDEPQEISKLESDESSNDDSSNDKIESRSESELEEIPKKTKKVIKSKNSLNSRQKRRKHLIK